MSDDSNSIISDPDDPLSEWTANDLQAAPKEVREEFWDRLQKVLSTSVNGELKVPDVIAAEWQLYASTMKKVQSVDSKEELHCRKEMLIDQVSELRSKLDSYWDTPADELPRHAQKALRRLMNLKTHLKAVNREIQRRLDPTTPVEDEADGERPPVDPDRRNSRSEYQDAIQIILQDNPTGQFETKTAIYRAVANRWELPEGNCRRCMGNWEKEPRDEQEWRDYLGV